MAKFEDLPLWRQCYKIAFPGIYDENDTYEQAEFKKAYKIRNLNGGVVSNDIIPDTTAKYNIGDVNHAFGSMFVQRLYQAVGSGTYSYDNIINNDNKTNIINNFEFSYIISSSRYVMRASANAFDNLGMFRISNYADYLSLIALKLDNLNRRVKALEEKK